MRIPAEHVETLAVRLACESVDEHVYGSRWFGYPDPDNDAEMAEEIDRSLPWAREKARRYLEAAGLVVDDG